MTKEATVIVIATGQKVNVYKSSRRNEWIEYPNCRVAHKPSELKFN